MAGIRKSNEPSVSYRRSLNLFVLTSEGERYSVAKCPARAFEILMKVAATTAKDPEAAAKALEGLTYDHGLDKWWAITFLLEAGAAIPLFGPAQEPVSQSCGRHRRIAGSQDDFAASEASSRGAGYQGIDPTEAYHLALPLGRL